MIPGCTFEHEVWGPHAGCREFMVAPEATYPCGRPAVAWALVVEYLPGDYDGDGVEEVSVEWACDEHAPTLVDLHFGFDVEVVAFAGPLGLVYVHRATAPRPLTADDEDLVRALLGR